MQQPQAGRRLLSGVALATALMGYLTDWNRTHLFNPRWPPHAKFHDAQTIAVGTLLGGSALALLWHRRSGRGEAGLAAWLLAVFWCSMASGPLFPHTAEADPEFQHLLPKIGGVPLGPTAVSLVMLLLTGFGYWGARQPGPDARGTGCGGRARDSKPI